jgi:hypothetical protein
MITVLYDHIILWNHVIWEERKIMGILKGIEQISYQEQHLDWAMVAHACNPSYLRGRDQEDCCSKPVQANSS